ncbi:NADH-ubiquinone oxidoreductase subunit, mitochondrial precursor, putative [Candida dubliniensis CD36]|uniref:NADH-ubiquinone oxidoreductase subunit, mitochondrial, putative n=1 Tax=Candida dubliniensis (strain CD36 / ATCC MYA-646 / CBS 7987 / NCPF 3949 / NRRL Y-17841) TaxID=573826 RepID=B9WCD5_CANDC|nr:NADH-ubiquinone oxidoreductase subunit, mitochondrial precursor, putative [Candida dubliniensis CD36]CAX44057.1 NADH-ubiquinone oxidoreductase subunit, mitochondrial precursor, putative [Candida dubliniensis CD36]
MLRITRLSTKHHLVFLRFNSSLTGVARPDAGQLNKKDLQTNSFANQSPNRNITWSPSQEERIEIINKYPYRFVQKDLQEQPRPYAAIDLIAQEPIKYLNHEQGNIAVCDGNRGSTLQGHPKVFINLDQPKPATCGYCGLRYAKEEFKEIIEANEA